MSNLKSHLFIPNDNLNLQNNYIFLDTETKRVNNEEKFYLGWLIFWNRKTEEKEYYYLKNKEDFYKYVLQKMDKILHLFIFAHNTDFDIKVLGGIDYFINNGYVVKSFYINGNRFIIKLQNCKRIIEILDTMNYIPTSLKYIGESIGLKKQNIDFNKCNDIELSNYCKNDVEIIFLFIKKLVEFLNEYKLSKLKPTVASLSLNIFRHKFYNPKKNPIYIHSWNSAIKLERQSYKGGISDCFKVGNFKNKQYKLDINSMYPYVMKKFEYPIKLILYRDESNCKKEIMLNYFNKYLDSKLIIARCKIFLPKEYSYILVKSKVNNEDKSIFLSGEYINTLTTPELKFVLKYGKILEIYNIAIYEKSNIFKDFVNFFYNQRIKFDKENNQAYKLFCKYILNSLYGKFGQVSNTYLSIHGKHKKDYSSKFIIDKINNRKYIEMCLGNKKFEIKNKEKNSYDSFVAISSFVTSYARMYLINMILQAKRENVYYIDTDCLIVNEIGFNLLKDLINKDEIGKLKLEEISNNSTYYRPKYYLFNEIEKCKGVKKIHKRIFEDNETLIIEQEQFTRFNSSLRKKEFDKQTVNIIEKVMSKKYDKGIILKNGDIEPYNINSNECIYK